MILTSIASNIAADGVQTYFSYLLPTTVLASAGLFVPLSPTPVHVNSGRFRSLAALTLVVYLVHPMILETFTFLMPATLQSSVIWIPLATAVVVPASFGVTRLLAFIPGIRLAVAG